MKVRALLGLLFIPAVTFIVHAEEPMTEPQTGMAAIAASNNLYAVDLYRRLSGEEGNLFFSPLSISTALAMTYAGARGETEAEMARVLHFDLEQAQLHRAFEALQASLNAADRQGYELSVANRLWGNQGTKFLEPFLAVTRDLYRAEMARLDFAHAPEGARQTINQWVSEKTREKIRDLLPPGSVDALTRLVLTNAIYFKGLWKIPFDIDQTQEQPFSLITGAEVQVPLMYQQEGFRYAELEGLQILELPYQGEDLSMVVLLPRKLDGLPALEKQLSLESIGTWLSEVQWKEVEVYLPRFTFSSSFSLGPVLSAMGMPSAFTLGKADFSGMNGMHDLFISEVVHKAFVDVNEEGTEAAAATGVMMVGSAMPVEPPVFRADHPFLFLIRDNAAGSLLFMGRVMNPIS